MTDHYLKVHHKQTVSLQEFREIGEEELRTIIKSAPTKSCENDPLTTSLLKEHLDAILTPLPKVVNTSLRNGEFSDNLKEALL